MIPWSTEEIFRKISDKQRIVIAGSEGTEFLASVMRHVLSKYDKTFDFFLEGKYEEHVGSSLAIIVASEKLSKYNPIPDFRKFHHHIGVICNVRHTPESGFASEDEYIRQYDLFADATPKGGILAFCEQDRVAAVICNKERPDVTYVPFKSHPNTTEGGKHYLFQSRILMNW